MKFVQVLKEMMSKKDNSSSERLERNKDWMNDYLKRLDNDELHIMQMHKELLDNVGIYIERPKIEPEMYAGTTYSHGSMKAYAHGR